MPKTQINIELLEMSDATLGLKDLLLLQADLSFTMRLMRQMTFKIKPL